MHNIKTNSFYIIIIHNYYLPQHNVFIGRCFDGPSAIYACPLADSKQLRAQHRVLVNVCFIDFTSAVWNKYSSYVIKMFWCYLITVNRKFHSEAPLLNPLVGLEYDTQSVKRNSIWWCILAAVSVRWVNILSVLSFCWRVGFHSHVIISTVLEPW